MEPSDQPRQPHGTPIGGQFAGKTNPESDVDLDPWLAMNEHPARRKASIAGHTYMVTTGSYGDGRRTYDLIGTEGGGWAITYDPSLKAVVDVKGRRPLHESAKWRDVGEANLFDVVEALEPEAETVTFRGREYKMASALERTEQRRLEGR